MDDIFGSPSIPIYGWRWSPRFNRLVRRWIFREYIDEVTQLLGRIPSHVATFNAVHTTNWSCFASMGDVRYTITDIYRSAVMFPSPQAHYHCYEVSPTTFTWRSGLRELHIAYSNGVEAIVYIILLDRYPHT